MNITATQKPMSIHNPPARKPGLDTRFYDDYYSFMQSEIYTRLQETARRIAAGLPEPALYREYRNAIQQADELLRRHSLIESCRRRLEEAALECAHGICHCEAVARDAAAIVIIEARARSLPQNEIERLSVAAGVAGLLHDIKRREEDHARLGSIEAGNILQGLGVDPDFTRYVTEAIRNHEAFKDINTSSDWAAKLVSDALYDADKFRWGPENFTTTLWLILESRATPADALHRTFMEKMKGIEKIKETFRTSTGQKYGPEFIDQGIEIGKVIFQELSKTLAKGG